MKCTSALTAALAASLTLSATAQDVIVEGSAIKLGGPSVSSRRTAPAAESNATRQAITSPVSAAYAGSFDGFGAHVDRDGSDVLVASNTDAFYFEAGVGFTFPGFIALAGDTVDEIEDVAIEGDLALVMARIGSSSREYRFERIAGVWTFVTVLSLTPAESLAEIHEGLGVITNENQFSGNVNVITAGLPSGSFNIAFLDDRTLVAMDAGDGADESGPNAAVIVTENIAGLREVHLFDISATGVLTSRGVIAAADASFDYGADVAVDGGNIWIGAPSFDGNATDAGLIELWVDDGTAVTFGGSIASGQAGDMWGESISAQNGVAVFGEREADLVPGSNGTGAARVLRQDDTTGFWTLTGEIIHPFDQQFGDGEDFGRAVANDGRFLAVGEPAPGVANGKLWVYNMPTSSAINNFQTAGIAGTNGEPFGGAFGMTFDNFPFLIEVAGARPSTVGQLVLGFGDLSASFKGGVLYPTPDILLPLPTDANGSIQLFTPWIDVGANYTLFMQFWIPDPAAVDGFAATGGFNIEQF